jgi:hypothetical protein
MKREDKYANLLVQSVTLSAANTITFEEINIGLNIFDKIGLLIHRLEYEPSANTMQEMTADGDSVTIALTQSNSLTTLVATEVEVIDRRVWRRHDYGAAAAAEIHDDILTGDFMFFPGGGLLVPPKPLYVGASSNGLASAAVFHVRLYFSIVQLTDAEYLELLETRRAFG